MAFKIIFLGGGSKSQSFVVFIVKALNLVLILIEEGGIKILSGPKN